MADNFYPSLSTLVTLDAVPEQLGFLKDGVSALLNKIYFKDLQVVKSDAGESAFYSLTLVLYKEAGVEIPGTGIELVLNPDFNASGLTEIPVRLSYEWQILKFINGFNVQSFSFEPRALFDAFSKSILQLSDNDLVSTTIGVFVEEADPLLAIQAFVAEVNAEYGTSIPNPTATDPKEALAEALVTATIAVEKDPFTIVYETFIDDLDAETAKAKLDDLFIELFGEPPLDYLKRLITPKISAGLMLGVGIVFPRNVLTPLDAGTNEPLDESIRSMITFAQGDFSFSTESGIGYDLDLSASLNHKSMIGKTGITIDLDTAKLDISRTTNIPEATADGRPDDFVGVYIKEVAIGLPPFIKDDPDNPVPSGVEIVGRNMIIGTGGISGTVGLETTGPGLCKTFGDKLKACFTSFDITFHQNSIISSNINGTLTIPGFKNSGGTDAVININIHIGEDGDFQVTASENMGITAIEIPGILAIDLTSVFVGREDDRWFFGISGAVRFDSNIGTLGNFLPEKLDVKKLIVWEDGQIEFEGGKITLPKAVSLKLGPVELSVKAIGLGSHEQEWINGGGTAFMRKYKYFTFDGGINVNPGGVDASGNGITFYWTTDDDEIGQPKHVFVRIQSIAIDIIIPGDAKPEDATLLLSGFLAMKDAPGGGTEYQGGVSFTLPKLKMGGSAAMRMNPKIPAFLIDVGLEMSSPIVLGATGLGIYGFRGLIGQRYVSTKAAAGVADTEPWWKYYKAKVAPDYREGIQTSKFEQKDGFSLGAGVSLATASDGGKAFSSKIFFLLSLPEVFLLQGQGQILKERIGLDTTQDPPFFALIAITSTSVETAFGVNYQIPDDGDEPGGIATVNGVLEMGFFWADAFAWYINIGKDQPADRRIQVRLLKLFNAYFYFMLSNNGIKAGAGASFSASKKFGPLKAELSAYLDVAGKVSRRPKQIGGSIQLGGSVGLKIFGFGFTISAAASLAAESPKPFIVSGRVEVCVRVLRKNRCAKFNFTWTFRNQLDTSETPLFKSPLSDSGKALNIHTSETFELWTGTSLPTNPNSSLSNNIIPLDSFIDIEFLKGVKPETAVLNSFGGNTMGSHFVEYVPPQRGKSDRVKHEYTVSAVDILYYDGSSWQPFDLYAANTPMNLASFVTTDLTTLKQGFWQYTAPNLHNKLRVLAQSPISYVSQGSGGLVIEDMGITTESIFCAPTTIAQWCVDFTNLVVANQPTGSTLIPENQLIWHEKFLMVMRNGDGQLMNRNFLSFTKAVQVGETEALEIIFPEPMPRFSIQLEVLTTTDATVSTYKRTPVVVSTGLTNYTYTLISTTPVSSTGNGLYEYTDDTNPVDRVLIEPGICEEPGGGLPCEPTITQQGRDLEILLDTLASNNHLSTYVPLDSGIYESVYLNSSLHDTSCSGQPSYRPLDVFDGYLDADIVNACGEPCRLELRTDEPGFDFTTVVGFSNLRVDPNTVVVGDNVCFLIDAHLPNGTTVTVRGCACWNVISCLDGGDPGEPCEPKVTKEGLDLINLLNVMAGNRQLTSRVNLLERPYDSVYPNSSLADPNCLEFADYRMNLLEGGTMQAEISTNCGKPCLIDFTQVGGKGSVDYDRILEFTNPRVDPESYAEGNNRCYLVDAVVDGVGIVTLKICACWDVIDCLPPCDPIVTVQGNDFEVLIRTLAENGHLIGQTSLEEEPYNAVFMESSLNNPDCRDSKFYQVTNTSNGVLTAEFYDGCGGAIPLTLQPEEANPEFDFESIIGFAELSPDPNLIVNGENNNFIIQATVGGGELFTFKGFVGWPVILCDPEGSSQSQESNSKESNSKESSSKQSSTKTSSSTQSSSSSTASTVICDTTPEAAQLALAIDSFFQYKLYNKQSEVLAPGNYYSTYPREFFNTVLYPDVDTRNNQVTYTRTIQNENVWAWTISDQNGYSCDFRLELIDQGLYSIFNLTGWHNLRVDPDNSTIGANYTFLIDAKHQGQIVTVRGTSCYPIANCIDSCGIFVYQVCGQTVENVLFNSTIPTQSWVDAEVQTIINSFNGSIQPIWRPNTNYAIRIQTKDKLNREGGAFLTEYNRTAVFAFRTMGPIGHFHIYRNDGGTNVPLPEYALLEAEDKEDEFKLQSLMHYLDYGKCYPNADGQLINAKPLFFIDPKLLLYYTRNYIYQMLQGWDTYGGLEALNAEFVLTVIDPSLDTSATGNANEEGTLSWTLSDLPIVSEDITILNNMMVYGDPCQVTTVIDPQYPVSNFQLPALEPLKLYTAVYHLKYKRSSESEFEIREVLRYPFQTSRYGSFAEQVRSWVLIESDETDAATKESVFTITKAFDATTNLAVATSILNDSMDKDDPLRQSYGNAFDRVMQGALELESVHPPLGTEFNLIIDSNTSNVIGVLVKNPEPFNDPKVPFDDMTGPRMIEMRVNGGGTFEVLTAKDNASVLITTTGMNTNISNGDTLEFDFRYVQYDGVSYVDVATESITFTVSI